MKKTNSILITIICFCVSQLVHAQCREDLFGKWEDLKGKMSIHTPDFNGKSSSPLLCTLRVENLDLETWGSMYYNRKKRLTIITYVSRRISDTSTTCLEKYHLEFAVYRNTSQELNIKPSNEQAIKLFGDNTMELFNQNYIRWDDIELNKLYFSMPNGRYSIDLSSGIVVKKKRVGKWKQQKYRYYTHELDSEFVDTLIANILSSKIIYMSVCDRKWRSASDTFSKFIAIDYNGRVINFTTYYLYDSVYPLYGNMIELYKNRKWRRLRDVDFAEKEFDYFYHYGLK